MRGRGDDDAGVGLAELLVVLAIGSVVLMMLGTTVSSTLRLSWRANAQTASTADARVALETVTRRLRVAVRPPFTSSMVVRAEPGVLHFYASLGTRGSTADAAPTLVEYATDPTTRCFTEALTPPTASTDSTGTVTYTWPTSSRRVRCVVPGGLDADALGVFTYFDQPEATTPLALTSGAVPSSALNSVRSVGLQVSLRSTPSAGGAPVRLRTRVTLTNRINEDTGRK